MMNLKDILNELEFASQKDFDAYSKSHNLRKSTKVTIAGRETTAGLAALRRGLPDKPKGKEDPIQKAAQMFDPKTDPEMAARLDKEKQKSVSDEKTDDKIYDFVSDWVISSLSDTEKRQALLSNIEDVEIPEEYKEVPSEYLYRAKRKGSNSKQKYVSYSYTPEGAERMKGWLKKIFGLKDDEIEIEKIPVDKVDVVISIPSFLKATKRSSGKRFDSLWKNETEVIVKQKESVNELKLNDLVGNQYKYVIGSGEEKYLGKNDKKYVLEVIAKALKTYLYDSNFALNYLEGSQRKQYDSFFENEILKPMLSKIDFTLDNFFTLDKDKVKWALSSNDTRKMMDEIFRKNKKIPVDIKREYYEYRLDYAGVKLKESSKADIIKDLDKAKNDLLKKVDVLIAKKKKLYSNVDIESPMTADEKKLDKDIADLFSQLNQLVLQKRSLKEDWSQKYKNSINCSNPKGFSQKAHCAGRKKNENMASKLTVEQKMQLFLEKNCPTDPAKWSASKAAAKRKFDVYPSAYANGWAAKNYKSKGGGWRTCKG